MLDLIASFLVSSLNRAFHVLPMHFNLWVGRRVAGLFYIFSGKRSSIAYANLKAAFSIETESASRGGYSKSLEELKQITKQVYLELAQTFVELISLSRVDADYIKKYVKIINEERIAETLGNPKGTLLVSAHFGDWELGTMTSAVKGYPVHLIGREQKMERLYKLLNKLRESKGNTVIEKGMGIKNIFRLLRNGETVGLLADQNAGSSGELVDFFGRPASTVVGPYRFAQKCGALILPAFMHRVNGPYHELVLEAPMEIKENDDVLPFMREYNSLLEKNIIRDPGQWLWMHKRWKMTPLKKILLLDDGKKGHLNQSLAVVKQIRRYREDEGFKSEHVEVDRVKVVFRSRFSRMIFNILSPFFNSRCQGRLRSLKRALTPDSFAAVANRYADVVISCGSGLSAVNKILKIENYARNLTIMDPGPLARKCFDLIVIPDHDLTDALSSRDNVISTALAPNLVQPVVGKRAGMNGSDGPCIGVLVGGDNSHFAFGNELVMSLATKVKTAAGDMNGCFYATTSRRTPASAETILESTLAADTRCKRFVLGRNDNDEGTVNSILSMSDVIVVSGESISMVSEAVSSGRPVLVFMPDKKTKGYNKFERFVDRLGQKGYLKRVSMDKLSDEIIRAARDKKPVTVPDDNDQIYKKMYRLF